MDIRFQPRAPLGGENAGTTSWSADCVIVPVFSGQAPLEYIPELLEAAPWLGVTPALRDFKAKKGETHLAYGHPEAPISRAVFCGLGKPEDFRPEFLRDAVAAAVKSCAAMKLERLAVPLEALRKVRDEAEAAAPKHDCGCGTGKAQGKAEKNKSAKPKACLIEEAVLGALLSLYVNDIYKTKNEDDPKFTPSSFSLLTAEASVPENLLAAARKAEAVAHGICYTRDLVNGPANVITPSRLEEEAQGLARKYGFQCTALGPDYLRDNGYGAFWAVARGATQEPRLIILEYRPESLDPDEQKPVIIVGKGVTFDSGGISLKPAAKMHEMKSDMAGAGTVLGLFKALGEALRSAAGKAASNDELGEAGPCGCASLAGKHIIGIIPASENMPDGNATRPGDIVTTLAGKTVEITNTDAEGRLLLIDCLTMAQERWQPAALIDIATLTGACVVALGEKTCGLFGNNDCLRDHILALGERCSERFWPLPVWDEDLDELKSDTADLNNTGPREGGALFAALFLKQFVKKETPWAHLDIAGPGYTQKKSPVFPGGASAFGLRTLFELIGGK